MKRSKLRLYLVALVAVLLGAGIFVARWPGADAGLNLAQLSTLAAAGKTAFDANCASCHGANGAGTANGPPLNHDIYNPGHHADESFFRAARNGVPQHHWRFGNMAPLPNVTDKQMVAIVRYVREMQEANGIFYRKHTM
ncbi:MAG: c-type cytochrome [Alphaproteobacteria bacterium]